MNGLKLWMLDWCDIPLGAEKMAYPLHTSCFEYACHWPCPAFALALVGSALCVLHSDFRRMSFDT